MKTPRPTNEGYHKLRSFRIKCSQIPKYHPRESSNKVDLRRGSTLRNQLVRLHHLVLTPGLRQKRINPNTIWDQAALEEWISSSQLKSIQSGEIGVE